MSWLEANTRILREIEKAHTFKFTADAEVGLSSRFVPSGFFDSKERKLWTGLKYPVRDQTVVRRRAASELAIYSIIAQEKPELIPMLPRFYGVASSQDTPSAGVMEDFSEGGRVQLNPCRKLPQHLLEVLDNGFRFGMLNSLDHIAFTSNGKIHLVDFYPAVFFSEEDEKVREEIKENLDKWTIKTALPKVET